MYFYSANTSPKANGFPSVHASNLKLRLDSHTVKINQVLFDRINNHTDHLGNIRVSYTKDPQTDKLKILDENHYYPFGLKHENYLPMERWKFIQDEIEESKTKLVRTRVDDYKYKYNGKEWQDELGLNFYDYGARNYDPAIGRWMNIDPLAEKFMDVSPYNYALNNPVVFIDPDGRMAGMPADVQGESKFDLTGMDSIWDRKSRMSETWYPNDLPPCICGSGDPPVDEDGYLTPDFEGSRENPLIFEEIVIIGRITSSNPYDNPNVAAAARGLYEAESNSAAVQDMDAWIKSGISWIPGGGLVYYPEMKAAFQSGNYLDGGIYIAGALPFGFGKVGGKGLNVGIKGFTKHGTNQAITRGFKSPDILKIVNEGNAVPAMGRYGNQTRYTLGNNTVILNAEGKVVTVFSNAPGTANGLGKGYFVP